MVRDGGRVKITFTGTLETAHSPAGPWVAVTNAISPWTTETTGRAGFYRTRETAGESIFSSSAIVELAISGRLQQHFDVAFAGVPDGIFPPVREKPYFDGSLELGELRLPVSLRVRGNSSLQECPFPRS
jgi:hypothetical protein